MHIGTSSAGIPSPARDSCGPLAGAGSASPGTDLHRRGVPRFGRWVALAALLLGMLALAGCNPTTPQSVFDSRSEFALRLQNLFSFIIWLAVVVFVVVEAALVYAVWRFRRQPRQGLPPQWHGNTRLEIAWTIAPALVLAVIAIPTVTTIFETQRVPTGADVLQIKVIAHQWWWEFQYPDQQIVTANEFHVPAGRQISLTLETADVIHSFWVPKLMGKRDVTPGHTNYIAFVADPPADGNSETFWGQCVEFCGTSHANMRLRAVVHTPEGFEAWVNSQQAPAAAPLPEAFMKFAQVERDQDRQFPGSGPASSCLVCHTIGGTNAQGKIGPDLSHLGSRQTIAAGMLPMTKENIAKWIQDPGAVKPGARMPKLSLSQAEIDALATYLASLQ
ncbi:MAG: cytochrome c oxidase subunit II [Chloroflexi bacterium]|nr:cytochrome c oxidase subunit II [Chloroflexota bacterium]